MSNRDWRLSFGLIGALLLAAGVCGLTFMLSDYDYVTQTVSEIGQQGSPVQLIFTILLVAVALCLVIFGLGVRVALHARRRSGLAGWLIIAMGVSAAGVGVFPHPHPLHNVFGLSELIGYQAPLALALTWRGADGTTPVTAFSWVAYVFVIAAIVLNLSPLAAGSTLATMVEPIYGLVQRSLFIAWFGWCAVVSLMLMKVRPVNM